MSQRVPIFRTARPFASLLAIVVGFAACSKTEDPPAAAGALSIAAAANGGDMISPLDAAPSPDGSVIYLIARSKETGMAGVYRVDAKGGAVTALATGGLLRSPLGIAVSPDGGTIYVADAGASTRAVEADEDDQELYARGAILTLSSNGGALAVLAGTENLSPRAVELRGSEIIFTGRGSKRSGVFSIAAAGGTATELASDIGDASGLVASASGDIFVVNSTSEEGAALLRLAAAGGAPEVVVDGLGVGFPGGVALTKNDKEALVSGIDPETRSDVVYRVNLATKEIIPMTDVVGDFGNAAGLHRAKNKDVFAWADSRAGGAGTVYRLGE